MLLPQTKYPNNIRTVSGTPTIYPDDVVLECNTSLAPVVINLLEIPDNYWSTQYKLYIIDISGNASANNITINAGSGQNINGDASLVISQDSGIVLIRIANNNSYIGTDSGSTPNVDTGWLDMNGFTWMDASVRPQYRVWNKQIFFRRSVVIPIEKAGSVIPWSSAASYQSETIIAPAPTNVVTNSAGTITFNSGNPVLQSASHYPDANYNTGWVISAQRRQAQAPVGSAYLMYYTTVFILQLTTGGILRAITLKNAEEGASGQEIGQSNLRYLLSKSISGSRILDYRNIVDGSANPATMVGRTNTGTANDSILIGLNSDTANHLITHDPAEETDCGGYIIPLNDLKAYLT